MAFLIMMVQCQKEGCQNGDFTIYLCAPQLTSAWVLRCCHTHQLPWEGGIIVSFSVELGGPDELADTQALLAHSNG